MNYSTLAKAAMFSLLGLLAAPAANATPVIYNYTMDVTATNISGLQDGSLNFTLSDAPTFLQELTVANLRNEVTAFDAHIDGLDFTSINACGPNPMGCLGDLEFFIGGSLASLDYIGTNAGITFSAYNGLLLNRFHIQSGNQFADGILEFAGNGAPTRAVPEAPSAVLMLGALALLGGWGFFGRNRMKAASLV